MKLNLSVLILLAALGGEAAGQESEFATGRAYYTEGEFKKAAAHFQLALKANPNDAESYYWMGMSYQVLADIAFAVRGQVQLKGARLPDEGDWNSRLVGWTTVGNYSTFCWIPPAPRGPRCGRLQTSCGRFRKPIPDYSYMRRRFEQREKGKRIGGRSTWQTLPRRSASDLPHRGTARVRVVEPRAAGLEHLHSGDGISSAAGIPAAGSSVW